MATPAYKSNLIQLGFDQSYFDMISELELVPLAKAMQGDDILLAKRIDTKMCIRPESVEMYTKLKNTPNSKIVETFSCYLADRFLMLAIQNSTNISTQDVIDKLRSEWCIRMEKLYFQMYNNSTTHKDKLRALDLIRGLHFDQSEEVYIPDINNPSPPTRFLFNVDGTPCVAQGDITAIKGKAKGGKSTFLKCLVACGIGDSGEFCGIKRNTTFLDGTVAPSGPMRILYFDTEQSRGTLDILLKDCIGFASLPKENSPRLKIVGTRTLTKEGRKMRFDEEVATGEYDIVIVDGVKDIVSDINDPRETDQIVAELLSVAETRNVALFVVLHENPGKDTDKMRGWLGTEITNKAFLVWQVSRSKEKGKYNINTTECRWKEPGPIAYKWDEDGNIESATPDTDNSETQSQSQNGTTKEERQKAQFLRAFEDNEDLSLTEKEIITNLAKKCNVKRSTAQNRIDHYVAQDVIRCDNPEGGREARYYLSPKTKHELAMRRSNTGWQAADSTNPDLPF